jgi:uncharacterized membrane protein YoaK (UPF0700 family)
MFSHKFHEKVDFKTYFDWFLLSFLAGNINAGGWLSCQRFVSHVTGFATLSGIFFEEGNWIEFWGTISIPLFFLLGVFISGYLTEKKLADKIHGQRYAPVMGISAILLLIVAICGRMEFFGTFGEVAKIRNDFFLMALLCMACGLQNAAITSASGATIRTTHLTGLTTDLGLGIIRAEVHHLSPEQRILERRANYLRLGTILSFTLGSVMAAFIYVRFKYDGFFLPSALSFYAFFSAHYGKHSAS